MEEWRRVLDVAPYYQVIQYTPTCDGTGFIPLTSLSQGSGDLQQNLYRILSVSFNNFIYQEVVPKDYFLANQNGVVYYCYFRNGQGISVPGLANQQATGIWVNWTPTRFDQLSTDNSFVGLPDDYYDIFTLSGAAALLFKGGAEAEAASALMAEADQKRRDRLQNLARLSINPIQVQYDDNRFDWAAQ
jgi:hypothetical protein